jgi:hypothetical protein
LFWSAAAAHSPTSIITPKKLSVEVRNIGCALRFFCRGRPNGGTMVQRKPYSYGRPTVKR